MELRDHRVEPDADALLDLRGEASRSALTTPGLELLFRARRCFCEVVEHRILPGEHVIMCLELRRS